MEPSADCHDNSNFCRIMKSLCDKKEHREMMLKSCASTCNLCKHKKDIQASILVLPRTSPKPKPIDPKEVAEEEDKSCTTTTPKTETPRKCVYPKRITTPSPVLNENSTSPNVTANNIPKSSSPKMPRGRPIKYTNPPMPPPTQVNTPSTETANIASSNSTVSPSSNKTHSTFKHIAPTTTTPTTQSNSSTQFQNSTNSVNSTSQPQIVRSRPPNPPRSRNSMKSTSPETKIESSSSYSEASTPTVRITSVKSLLIRSTTSPESSSSSSSSEEEEKLKKITATIDALKNLKNTTIGKKELEKWLNTKKPIVIGNATVAPQSSTPFSISKTLIRGACFDDYIYCREFQALCGHPAFAEAMTQHCTLTCEKCNEVKDEETGSENCKDTTPECPSYKDLCRDPEFSNLMANYCSRTCSYCLPLCRDRHRRQLF
ncbi:hypothetical protein WR25_17770 isoform A [Diploscapter pachys]|uniref:ShKT domain-containing protein n=1 Tax=Diploscapter pachys TaxID=2018661 RepID=A0A2A2LPJ8_9BILA|nr:hypothetical protein WR25_17770 isoform A [Diploscapter pachys]